MAAARRVSGRAPKARGRKGQGAPPRGAGGGRRKQHHSSERLLQQKLRQKQGGSLPRRPDIKGLDGEGDKKKDFKNLKSKNSSSSFSIRSSSSSSSSSGRPLKGEQQQQQQKQQKQHGGSFKRREGGSQRLEKSTSEGSQRKRKLSHGQERLRDLLSKHPELLHPGESADAAVAACFKKAAGGPTTQLPEATSEAPYPSGKHASGQQQPQQQQQVSGSKRRKLLRLVMSSRTAEEKVFVHKAYQIYNEILRSIRAAEGGGERSTHQSASRLQSLVAKAVSFLEGPLAQQQKAAAVSSCSNSGQQQQQQQQHNAAAVAVAAAAAAALHAGISAPHLLFSLSRRCFVSEDFNEFCCCKSFHHVAMKLHLYGTEKQRERLIERLVGRKEAAFTRESRWSVSRPVCTPIA
ncbi:hypothetical protein ACSSS7_003515 [Eimeria intestinalis]